MTTFEEIEWARKILGLGQRATLEEIKSAYRNACKRYHPDHRVSNSSSNATEEKGLNLNREMQEINRAYSILQEFIKNYRYLLVPDEEENFDPESWWWKKFGSAFTGDIKDTKPEKRKKPQD